MKHFVLNGNGQPVEETNLEKWAKWYETAVLVVAYTQLANLKCVVRTKFLGSVLEDEPPFLYWETSVIGMHGGFTDKCSGPQDQAEEMHRRMVEKIKQFT